MNKFITKFLTILRGKPDFSKTREVLTPSIREPATTSDPVRTNKFIMESFNCPYCFSKDFQKRGFRQKKLERVQLYLCNVCGKTFSVQNTKGKHYPLSTMLDAISIYNLGYSLEQTCRILNERLQKSRLANAAFSTKLRTSANRLDPSQSSIDEEKKLVNSENVSVQSSGHSVIPNLFRDPLPKLKEMLKRVQHDNFVSKTEQIRENSSVYTFMLQPSTLSNWLEETKELCRFGRMREFALKKFSPKDMVIHATLAHRQLYRYRFHRAKCDLMIKEEYRHRKFMPLQEFLEMVPAECPHQFFQEGLRASEAPLTFSKKQMIVRAKQNYANKLCTFVLQSVKERKLRHEALQRFMLANDSVTVATEIPVYITRDDLEHLKTQLGFTIYIKNQISKIKNTDQKPKINNDSPHKPVQKLSEFENASLPKVSAPIAETDVAEIAKDLPKLITGHIDLLQIRNGQIHILDYKPNAEKERPIEQLTLYAMALSRLTGLRLFEFKCAWFDEKDYFEFYPLHVLHKSTKTKRRRKVYTMEGIYQINRNSGKIENVRPSLVS